MWPKFGLSVIITQENCEVGQDSEQSSRGDLNSLMDFNQLF